MSAQPMIRFIAANGLVVCSISTIVNRLESTRSNSCTKRSQDRFTHSKCPAFPRYLLAEWVAVAAICLIMRRVITYCLIVSMVCAGVAWAADRHAEAFFGHGAEWMQSAEGHLDTGNDTDTCDHCCHGSAHYAGLPMAESATTCFRNNHNPASDDDSYLSLVLPPLTQPPIV